METAISRTDECLYLLGHASLAEFLGFVANEACAGAFENPRALTDDWNTAWQHFSSLERTEAGCADGAAVHPLPAELQALGRHIQGTKVFQRAFPVVPTHLGMVDLERVIVCQRHVNLDHVRRIQQALPSGASADDVFNVCLPPPSACPPLQHVRQGANSWVVVSPAKGLRLVETVALESPAGYEPRGATWGVIGAVVGFGCEYLNVIQAGSRLILNNGTHRAVALLGKGITQVPCVVQRVNGTDELAVVGAPDVIHNTAYFLQSARPPLLRDFLDARLCRQLRVPRTQRCLKITMQVEEVDVPLA